MRLQHSYKDILTRHPRGGRIEDACGEVTGHPDRSNAKPWSLTCWLVGWSVPGRRSVENKFGLERGLSRSSWTSVLPIGRRRVSLRCSTGVFCAGVWLESCHDGGRRGRGRVSRADGRAGMFDALVGQWVGPWGEVSLTTSSGSNVVNHGRRG